MNSIYSFFRTLHLPALVLFLGTTVLYAQNDCSEKIERAEMLFDQGLIEDIPGLLKDCIRYGFNAEDKIRAQKLLILAYLFDNKIEEAETVMIGFLNDNPEYEIQSGDPSEFTTLFSGFRTYPFFCIGAFLGSNLSSATMLQPYGPFNPDTDKGEFSVTPPQFQLGIAASFYLTDNMELNIESIYTKNSFSYSNLQYGFAEIHQNETLRRLDFPVSVTYEIPLLDNLEPYARVGLSYGFILSARSDIKKSYTGSLNDLHGPVETRNSDIGYRRKSGLVNGIMGAGVKYKIPRGHLFVDLRYSFGLSRLVNDEGRWDQETVFRYYYADSDFQLDYFSISIGYRYSFFKSTKI